MRRLGLVLGTALLISSLALLAGSRRLTRIAVSGHSMEPTLRDGDFLLVDRSAAPTQATIVVVRDPRARDRLIVKRVRSKGPDSQLMLVSDHPAHADEVIGPVAPADVVGAALFRYWPLSRAGTIRGV